MLIDLNPVWRKLNRLTDLEQHFMQDWWKRMKTLPQPCYTTADKTSIAILEFFTHEILHT